MLSVHIIIVSVQCELSPQLMIMRHKFTGWGAPPDSVIIKGGQRGVERGEREMKKVCVHVCVCVCVCMREGEEWVVAKRGSSVGCHYERWFPYWIIHHTSAVCLLPFFCVVMRINADKPRGNSDYYFQHITAREGEQERRDRGGKERQEKAKHKEEPHGAHNHLHGGVPENMRYRKKWVGGECWRISGCFLGFFCIFFPDATKFTEFASLAVDSESWWVL